MRVKVLRRIESDKFGIVIDKGSICNATTEDGERFSVSAAEGSHIHIMVDSKDLRILSVDSKEVYVIAEYAKVMDDSDGDGLDNEEEPVVCLGLGCWVNRTKAEKKCDKLNKEYEPAEDEESTGEDHFIVKTLKVNV